MILMIHFLFGATLVLKIEFLPLALALAFLSHYLLDILPHWEYSIENILEKKWKKSFKDFLKVFFDLSLGIFLLFIFSKNFFLSFMGGLAAILPDGFTLLGLIYSHKLLMIHESFHRKIHFFKNSEKLKKWGTYGRERKISPFWGILAELLIFLLAIIYLLQ